MKVFGFKIKWVKPFHQNFKYAYIDIYLQNHVDFVLKELEYNGVDATSLLWMDWEF